MKIFFNLSILLSLFFYGCTTAPVRYDIYFPTREMDFTKDYSGVWSSLLDILSSRNEPITTIEKESGIIVTDFVRIDKDALVVFARFRTGIFGLTGYTEGRYKLNIRVKEVSPVTTNVRINVHIEGFWSVAAPYGWHSLESRGVLEEGILEDLSGKIGDLPKGDR